jgi:TATA-box binding protein (TBP) (component of TFIID and TFIIIB)
LLLLNQCLTGVVFASGILRTLGVTSMLAAKTALRSFAYRVKQCIAPEAKFTNFNVQNLVARVVLPFGVKLETLVVAFGRKTWTRSAEYEPEQFPALRCAIEEPKTSISVYTNGKVLVMGAKSLEEARAGFAVVYPTIWEHRVEADGGPRKIDREAPAEVLEMADIEGGDLTSPKAV